MSSGCAAGSAALNGSSSSAKKRPPNIIFVLTDDLNTNLLPYMPQVQQMQREGMSFGNYYVTDSLCCPSRTTTFTGRFPHNTGVFTNSGDDGGFGAFNKNGNQNDTFATSLKASGYNTALMGKYLNGYDPKKNGVPPGWTDWAVAGNGYPEYNYSLNVNGKVVKYGKQPKDYLTNVISNKGQAFIKKSVQSKKPFMLELSTFAPHGPATPAPKDKNLFPTAKAPRSKAFNESNISDKPSWLRSRSKLTKAQIAKIDASFRKRARSVQAVDRMIANLRATLKAQGQDRNTYLVFSSDNGFHLGEHRLTPGKQTAFDSDIRVPLVVLGPGVRSGSTNSKLVQNTDLRPTFEQIAGRKVPSSVDGHGLLPYLRGKGQSDRRAVLVEHHGPNTAADDPDRQDAASGNPPSYAAIRTDHELYVEYITGEREYYDLRRDPQELNNTAKQLSRRKLAALKAELNRLKSCKGTQCK